LSQILNLTGAKIRKKLKCGSFTDLEIEGITGSVYVMCIKSNQRGSYISMVDVLSGILNVSECQSLRDWLCVKTFTAIYKIRFLAG